MKEKKQLKTVKFQLKQTQDDAGTFEGYASVFGNIDAVGDIVVKGAFTRTIQARDGKFKMLWNHRYDEPPIGKSLVEEDEHGLFFKGTIFHKQIKRAEEVWLAIKEGLVDSMSFMYDVIQSEYGTINGQTVRFLKELKLYEISPVNFPCNDLAMITDWKGQDVEDVMARLKALEDRMTLHMPVVEEFKAKMAKDFEALHQKIAELASKGTSVPGGPANGLKEVSALLQSMRATLQG